MSQRSVLMTNPDLGSCSPWNEFNEFNEIQEKLTEIYQARI